jgi:hypothetical protein
MTNDEVCEVLNAATRSTDVKLDGNDLWVKGYGREFIYFGTIDDEETRDLLEELIAQRKDDEDFAEQLKKEETQ